ncbi:MAG: transposase [Nanoarchaeota archaeon]
MSPTYSEIPQGLKKYLRPYLKRLTKPQQPHFSTLIAGLIVHENKTLQEINDAFSNKDQSSLNRFVNNHDFNVLNKIRLAQVQRALPSRHDGLRILDNSLAHKTGRCMESAGYHRSGITKEKEWGHDILNSYYTHPDWKIGYPITAEICTAKSDKDHAYKSIKHMALDQTKYAHAHGVKGIICADTLFYADYVVHELDDCEEKYLLGAPCSLKISVNREKRVSIQEYFKNKTFHKVQIGEKGYHIATIWAGIRDVGTRRIICSYRDDDPDDKRYYVTNLTSSEKDLMRLLVCRWRIECFHRDAKQHLGFEDYQVRKDRAVRNVVLAVLIAYTILVLSLLHTTLRRIATTIGRPLKTIGELCRFMRLAARKKWRWITSMLHSRLEDFKKILNREVLVKNAKV